MMMKRAVAFVAAVFIFQPLLQASELRISQAQALEMALLNNPELKSARLDLEIARLQIEQAKAQYDPYFSTGTNFSRSNRPTSTPAFGNENKSDSVNLSTGMATPSGGNVSLTWSNSRTESNSSFITLNPSFSSDLSFNISQPLLKNGLDWAGNQLKQKTNDYRRAELNLKSKALEIASRVDDAYWSLVRSRMNLELAQKSLARAESQFQTTQAQVRAGLAAEVSLLQAQANMESARVQVLKSMGELARAENSLKELLYFSSEEELAALTIIPSDTPLAREYKVLPELFLENSLAKNFTLQSLELNLENQKIDSGQTKNQLLPQLDFNAGISLSGMAGRADQSSQLVPTGFVIPNPFDTPQPYMLEFTTIPASENELEGDWNDAVDTMLRGDYLSWQAGLNFKVYFGNRQARAQYEISKYNLQKAQMDLVRQKHSVRFNLESLLTDLDSAYKSWQAAKLARELSEKSYQIEQKKFSLGMSTQYNLLDQENQLRQAESTELSALIEYNKAVGRVKRAEQGYLESAGFAGVNLAGVSISPSSLNLGSLGGLSGLSSLSSMLPAGVDLNMLKSLGINLP